MRLKNRIVRNLLIIVLVLSGTVWVVYAGTGIRKWFRAAHDAVATAPPVADPGGDIDSTDEVGDPTGEDPWMQLDSLVKAYYGPEGGYFRGKIKVIDANGEKDKVVEQTAFTYEIGGNTIYYSLANMEFIRKKHLVLIADHSSQVITVNYSDMDDARKEKGTNQFFDIREFKKLMEQGHAHAVVTRLGDGQKILTIDSIQDPSIQGYRIYYKPGSFRVEKMLIGMLRLQPLEENDGQPEANGNPIAADTSGTNEEQGIDTYTYYLEISYEEIRKLGIPEADFRPENKFIQVTNGHLSLASAFSKYRLEAEDSPENENKP